MESLVILTQPLKEAYGPQSLFISLIVSGHLKASQSNPFGQFEEGVPKASLNWAYAFLHGRVKNQISLETLLIIYLTMQNISPVASQLISQYKSLARQKEKEKEEPPIDAVSPRYGKTAIYYPQSPIEEETDEDNSWAEEQSTRLYRVAFEDEECRHEISELRRMVDQMRLKYMRGGSAELHVKHPLHELQQPQPAQVPVPTAVQACPQKPRILITNKNQIKQLKKARQPKPTPTLSRDQARQLYGLLKN